MSAVGVVTSKPVTSVTGPDDGEIVEYNVSVLVVALVRDGDVNASGVNDDTVWSV